MIDLFNNYTVNQSHAILSENEMQTITIITAVTASLSFLGSGSIILSSVFHHRVSFPEVYPIFHLSIADVLASVFLLTNIISFLKSIPNIPGNNGTCDYISSIMMSFYVSTFLLTLCYALEAFLRTQRRLDTGTTSNERSSKAVSHPMMYLAYSLSWLLPLAVPVILISLVKTVDSVFTSIVPRQCSLCFPVFHFDETVCWEQISDSKTWHFSYKLLFLLPLVIVFIINMFLYICIARKLQQLARRRGLLGFHQRQEGLTVKKKAILYQSAFICSWLPSLVLGFLSLTSGFHMADYYWLYILQALLGPLQGFLNCIIYGWKRESFRRALSESTYLVSTNRSSYMTVTI